MATSLTRQGLDRRVLFAGIVAAMVLIAAGHLYLIQGLTDLVVGLPLWLWVHLLVVIGLLAVAWVATGVVAREA